MLYKILIGDFDELRYSKHNSFTEVTKMIRIECNLADKSAKLYTIKVDSNRRLKIKYHTITAIYTYRHSRSRWQKLQQ